MLNPPLSLLSDDLLSYIVDHVARLRFPSSKKNLYNLSITDRAFTRFCQAYFFKDLRLGYRSTNCILSKKLAKIRNILNDEPSFANRVRAVHITVADKQNNWLFNDPDFISITQFLSKSLMPPHKLHLTGYWDSFIIEDPIFVAEWLMQSFFSQTMTVLDLSECKNVPLTLFLVCPNLREVYLEFVEVFDSTDDEYPDTQCSGRESPALEILSYHYSESLIKQMITPPPNFSMAAVAWSKLRVLKLCPADKKDMVCLQPILDAACNTLEELYLTDQMRWYREGQLDLAGLVSLRHLLNLHIFEMCAIIRCDAQETVALREIDYVLSTIPKVNQVTKLSLYFAIIGEHPFGGCLEEDWVGMCNEVVRISAGKPLELNLEISPREFQFPDPERDELYGRIKEKIVPSLSNYPNICIHWYLHSEI